MSKINIASLFDDEEEKPVKENNVYKTITEGLNNYLSEIEGCFRVPCFVKEGVLFCYLAGGSHFVYDPAISKITKLKVLRTAPINVDLPTLRKCIDCGLLRRIFEKLTKPKEKPVTESLKEIYRIDKKRLRQKDLDLISKYEQALKNKK